MKSNVVVALIAVMIAALVLAIDQVIPLGVAGGVPYVLAVAVAALSPSRRLLLGMALLCSLLVGVGYFASPDPGGTEMWKVVTNRCLAVVAIWIVAVMGLRRPVQTDSSIDANLDDRSIDKPTSDARASNGVRHEPVVWVIIALLIVAGGILVAHQRRVQQDVVRESALQVARTYSDSLTAFRSLYTSEVVEPARSKGIVVKRNYHKENGEIPLPATLSIKLSEAVGKGGSGIKSRLASPYPFPGRGIVGEHRDDFARDAWNELTKDPGTPFVRTELLDGEQTLRYATADVMRQSCIDCHNTHPETPKNDWAVGDVRGVLEVEIPIGRITTESAAGIRQSVTLFAIFGVVVLSSILLVVTRLKRNSEELEQRVAERTRELSRANEALVQSNKDLDHFVYITSHDLKEPLRGIANYSSFLAEDYADVFDDAGRQKMDTVDQLCKRMENLLDTLLQFSRVGRAGLAKLSIDINDIVAEVNGLMRSTIEEHQIDVRIPERLPTVHCDPVRVRELYNNLISNAIKFNDKPQKWIEIGCERRMVEGDGDAKHLVFYVRDNGIGIRDKHLEVVFRIFKRLHARDKYGGGTGAGLTFSKQIVERHGGTIWVESVYGEGTTVFFTLDHAD